MLGKILTFVDTLQLHLWRLPIHHFSVKNIGCHECGNYFALHAYVYCTNLVQQECWSLKALQVIWDQKVCFDKYYMLDAVLLWLILLMHHKLLMLLVFLIWHMILINEWLLLFICWCIRGLPELNMIYPQGCVFLNKDSSRLRTLN